MAPMRDRTTWLHGDMFHCLQPPTSVGRPWRFVLLGPPGVGKGTQATLLSARFGACPLSTGDIFRAAHDRSQAPGSEMAEALARVNRGDLVPDDVVLGLLQNRRQCLRCRGGFLLDGFPRTLAQASALDGLMTLVHVQLDAVIDYQLAMPALVARLAGRRVCERCQAPYHIVARPPRREGICDHCGGRVSQRPDDAPAAVGARLKAYAEATALVADYYQRQGLLVKVHAGADPEKVFARTLAALEARGLDLPRSETPSPAATDA